MIDSSYVLDDKEVSRPLTCDDPESKVPRDGDEEAGGAKVCSDENECGSTAT